MSGHLQANAASLERLRLKTILQRLGRLATIPLLAWITQGCTATATSPFIGPDPSDSSVRTPAVSYRSTLGSYTSQRPVTPGPWREQNERAAPVPKSGE